MKTILRLLFFWIKVIAVVLFIVAIAGSSFFIAMDMVNLSILVKDGMAMRTNVVLAPDDYEADQLTKFFTTEYLATDSFLNDNVYDQYEIYGYDYDTKVERVWCWPWQNAVTMTIACTNNTISGEMLDAYLTQDQIDSGETVEPPRIENMRYRVECERIDDKWTIVNLEFVETFEDELEVQKEEEPKLEEIDPEEVQDDAAQQGEQTQE